MRYPKENSCTGSGNMQERYSVNIEDGLKNAGLPLCYKA